MNTELTSEEIDILCDYHMEHHNESDDVDREEYRAEVWVESLTHEEAQKIINKIKNAQQNIKLSF